MSDDERVTVAIIDDDQSVRSAVKGLLETVALEVATFGSVKEFLDADASIKPSCIIVDVRLPGLSGFDLQRYLSDANIHTPMIFLTGHGDIPMSVKAMKGGAIEFLTKPFRDQELVDAVLYGIESARTKLVETETIGKLKQRHASLTKREAEIMALLVAGHPSKQVAGWIGISAVTARVHRAQVMKKMGARSIAELVRMADKLKAP